MGVLRYVRTLFLYAAPALLTSTSTRPCADIACATTAFQSSMLVTSIFIAVSEPARFCAPASAAVAVAAAAMAWAPSTLTSPAITLAPSWANRVAIAAPKPEPPPVDSRRGDRLVGLVFIDDVRWGKEGQVKAVRRTGDNGDFARQSGSSSSSTSSSLGGGHFRGTS